MPTIHFGKRAGRTRGRPENRATADGSAVIDVRSSGTDEVLEVQTITHDAFGGTFTLTLGSDTTSAIAFDAVAATIKTRIEADFTTVTTVNVTGSTGDWDVAFDDDAGDIALMTANGASLVTSSVIVTELINGVANVYQVTSIYTDADTGNITFGFGGNNSASTAYNANSATVDTNFTNITGVTDVAVSGAGTSGDPWIITFADPAGDAGAVSVTIVDATLAGATVVATTQQGADNVYEIVEIYNEATSGTFTLTFGGQTTDPLAWDSAFGIVDQELTALSSITDVGLSGLGTLASPWIVTFADPAGDVGAFTADDTNLNGGTPTTVFTVTTPGVTLVNEIQTIHRGLADGGTFTVTHAAQTTAAIAWDVSAADLKTALELISSITTVAVTGTGTSGDPWTIAFTDPSGVEAEVTTTDTLTITATATIADDTPGIDAVNEQQLVTVNNGTGGTHALTYDAQETGTLAYNLSAAGLETALELLSSITAATVTGVDGGPYTVEFVTPGGAPLALMTDDDALLTGVAVTVSVVEDTTGVSNVNETQEIVVDGDTGTFTLSYAGQTTAAIAYSANAALIDTRLTALSNINDVAVTGLGTRKSPFVVVFTDPVGDVAKITSTVTSLSHTVVVAARATGSSGDRE